MSALALILGAAVVLVPAAPAFAADGTLTLQVRITDTNDQPITQVYAKTMSAYRVAISYSCSVADCQNAVISVAPPPTDSFGQGQRKETSVTYIPPQPGMTLTNTGLGNPLTMSLGTVAAGTGGLLRIDYVVNAQQIHVATGNFFPDGSAIQPDVTITADNAAPKEDATATATWKSDVPVPSLTLAPSAATVAPDTPVTVSATSNSGCWRKSGGVVLPYPWMTCGQSGTITVDLPADAVYVAGSGGVYNSATNSVTLTTGPSPLATRSMGGAFQVTFPSSKIPTTGADCVRNENFLAHDAVYTFLGGATMVTNPPTAPATVTVGNCAPFAKASFAKSASSPKWTIPVTGDGTAFWVVTANNQSNVPGVATITDNGLDLPGVPVYAVAVIAGGPAHLDYTLDDGTTGSADNVTGVFNAPVNRHFAKVTATSSPLAGPNVADTGTGSTPFTLRYLTTLKAGATTGTRTNTASATMTYPDNPELGTITPTGSPSTYTITLAQAVPAATPFTITASNLTPSSTGTPVVNGQVTWTGSGSATNIVAGTPWTPQYVYLAPLGWNIQANGASLASPGVAGATFSYKTVSYAGNSYQAVIVNWPGPVTPAANGSYTLPALTVKTTPTGAALAGTNNQKAYLFVGDVNNTVADAYTATKVTDDSDVDLDGSAADVFAQGTGVTSLATSPNLDVDKDICRPDATASDGCDWIPGPNSRVGVPPNASSIRYRVTITNTGNGVMSGALAYDVLPYIGDTGTSTSTAGVPRGSTVQETLASVANVDPNVTLAYSGSTNPPRPEVYSGTTTGTWTAPLVGASAIKATIGSLAPRQSVSFEYTAALVGGSADQIACNSVAAIDAARALTPVEPGAVCATTEQADFSILSADHLPLQAGRVGLVPFVVTNGGGSQLASGTVTISVPAELSVAGLGIPGWNCTAPSMDGPVDVTCTPVNPDGSPRLLSKGVAETLALPVEPSDAAPAEICVDAAVATLMNDPDPDNDTAESCSVAVAAQPELVVDKNDGKAAVSVGETYTYTLTAFSRLVAETIDGVSVTDTLPDSLEFVSANPAPTSTSGQTLSWDLGQLQQSGIAGDGGDVTTGGPGSSKSVTVTVRVKQGAQDLITNTADAVGTDSADSSPLSAEASDQDAVDNVFTDLHPAVSTPQNQSLSTPLSDIVTAAGASLDPRTVAQQTAPAHGSLTIDASTGAVTYIPDAGYSGSDSYQIKVCDTSTPVQCTIGTVSVAVAPNTVTAVDDTAATSAGTPVTTDVRANDTTASGTPLAAPTIATQPARGSVAVVAGGIAYTPNPRTSGADSYGYQVCDTSHPTPVCDTATVTVTVNNVFVDGPAAQGNLGVETAQNAPVTTPLSDIVTVNGSPVDPASVVEQTAPANGSVDIDPATGAVTYNPDAGYSGPDSYALHLCDTSVPTPQCHDVTVAVTVLANDVAAPDLPLETLTNQTADPLDVLGAAVSSSQQPLAAAPTIVTDPAHGTVTVNADGTLSYEPEKDYDGADSFVYQVCDTSHPDPVCDTGTVHVTVRPVADLQVTKTVSDADVTIGDTAQFTLTVTNNGPSASGGVVQDTPKGMSFVSYTASQGTFDGVTWTVGTLASGETATLTAVYKVTLMTAENAAAVTGDASDPDLSNNDAAVTLHVSPRATGLASTGLVASPLWPLLAALLLALGMLLVALRLRHRH
jgi:uncharacterized repeat protein (TIGR01451 family)